MHDERASLSSSALFADPSLRVIQTQHGRRDAATPTPAPPPPQPKWTLGHKLTLAGLIVTGIPMFIAAMFWLFNYGGTVERVKAEQADQKAKIESTAKTLADHIEASKKQWQEHSEAEDARWDEIQNAVIENQVLMVESVDHITEQLGKMSSEAAAVEEPAVLEQARESAVKAKARERLFSD